MELEDKLYSVALSQVKGVGIKTYLGLISRFETAENALNQRPEVLKKLVGEEVARNIQSKSRELNLKDEIRKFINGNIKISVYGDDVYPRALAATSQAPICLFYIGNLRPQDLAVCISVVGTRKVSATGKEKTYGLVEKLASRGITIVSGMAFGIDKFAHQAAIDAGGKTIAVLASGPDIPSPFSNRELYDNIISSGGAILSEFYPGTQPRPEFFPKRNRIIAGMSLGTVVIEASSKSGSLITANIAFSEGREVFALPVDSTNTTYNGTNKLIKENKAKLTENADDVLTELGIINTGNTEQEKMNLPTLSKLGSNIYDLLRREPLTPDKIVEITGCNVEVLNSELTMLELEGVIQMGQSGEYNLRINN